MHRIDSSTATPDNKFTEGDPTIPVAATTVTAGWLNAVQEEIVKVVLESGLELDKSDNTQLLQALLKIIGVKAPIATTKAPGLVQVGTGLSVTAAGLLSVLAATVARAGIVELATTDETKAGKDSARAVTPEGLAAWGAGLSDALAELNTLRKLSIGAPKLHRSTTLPPNHAWPDGSLVLFADWPELKAVYDAGGFAGMLMAYNANATTQAANLGKFRPNAANPTGLYLPLHGGQFFRAWVLGGDGSAGGYNAPGLPNVQGYALIHTVKGASAGGALSFGNFEINQLHTGGADWGGVWLNIDASHSNTIYGASPTVMPPSVDIPVIIYLGRPK